VKARTTTNRDPKKRADWKVDELVLVARFFEIPEFVFFMQPDDAFAAYIELGLAKRPSTWNTCFAGQAA
jgi:hypothetical protein